MSEERTAITLKNKGEKIFAILHTSKAISPPDKIVVILHGFASTKVGTARVYVKLAEAFGEAGIATLRFDMRGCGDSEGALTRMTYEDFVTDLLTVLAYLERGHYKRIGLFGSSFGGTIAIEGALRSSLIRSLVLWAPVASGELLRLSHETSSYSLSSQFQEEFAAMRADLQLEKLGDLPLLHFHGEKDEVISLEHQRSFKEHRKQARAATQFITYPQAAHSLGKEAILPEVIERSITWFKETL